MNEDILQALRAEYVKSTPERKARIEEIAKSVKDPTTPQEKLDKLRDYFRLPRRVYRSIGEIQGKLLEYAAEIKEKKKREPQKLDSYEFAKTLKW